ncbi:hypothetical protein [Marinibacterium sp. SX1]|uniref:hypothetical protein n=1 Tax=Marinibacterium sp. SX1 TaxID=3388424 RepID=UPI003D175A2D
MTIENQRPLGKRPLAGLACLAMTALVAGCMETSGSTSSIATGTGNDSGSGNVTGSINERSSGGYTFVLNRDGGVCTAVFDAPPAAGDTELSNLNCSGGGAGTATVVYADDATPDRVVYAVNGEGGGTITF